METAIKHTFRVFESQDNPEEFVERWDELKANMIETEKLQMNMAYLAGFYDSNAFAKTYFSNFYKDNFQNEEEENSNQIAD